MVVVFCRPREARTIEKKTKGLIAALQLNLRVYGIDNYNTTFSSQLTFFFPTSITYTSCDGACTLTHIPRCVAILHIISSIM